MGSAKLIGFLLALNFFFVAIKLLGAFKDLGSGYGEVLIQDLAQNPFFALFIGILVTSVIQSSSTTTSLAVGLVAAGALGDDPSQAIRLAVPIIMGANIGTSVTNMLVSMGHMGNRAEFERAYSSAVVHDIFNWLTVLVLLPLQITTNFLGRTALFLAEVLEGTGGLKFTSPIKYLVAPQQDLIQGWFEGSEALVEFVVLFGLIFALFQGTTYLARRVREKQRTLFLTAVFAVLVSGLLTFGEQFHDQVFNASTGVFLCGLGLLFITLTGMVSIMRTVVLDRVQRLFDAYIFRTGGRAVLLGMLVTAMVQSSSVTTSLIVPLAGAGLLTLYQVLPYTIGANIGTTITAILAALSLGEVGGVAVAFAHLLFNLLGLAIFYPLRRVPITLAQGLGKLALRSPLYPVSIIVGAHFVIPLLLIALFH